MQKNKSIGIDTDKEHRKIDDKLERDKEKPNGIWKHKAFHMGQEVKRTKLKAQSEGQNLQVDTVGIIPVE